MQQINNNLAQSQQIKDDARSVAQNQLQLRALNIIMLLWGANADPLKPARLNTLPVEVTNNNNVVTLLLSKPSFYISILMHHYYIIRDFNGAKTRKSDY